MTEAAPQRSLFFQPALSRANSAESVQKKANGISPQMQSLTFNSLSAEGDMLLKNANYERAVQSFSKALEYRPGDRGTLVSRSRCYMLMGKTEQAIRDVDKVLEADKTYARVGTNERGMIVFRFLLHCFIASLHHRYLF
eukprot:TRINITY_DN101_c0_g2_i4.p2 TRINITY_DN101_c0_g2~~TRINITY_DN101_c0_g2_i4.p2  ORF type:complete len:139 (-),score=24.17 TRINITY_DN101_c0_g2_i4:102-518(-)